MSARTRAGTLLEPCWNPLPAPEPLLDPLLDTPSTAETPLF